MNKSSAIKAHSSIFSGEDCFLPLSHGIALMVVDILIALFGTFGNFLVCIAILTNPRLRRGSNIPLLSLAIADLIVTMTCEPLVVAIVGKRTLQHECTPVLERAYSLTANLSCSSSLMHLVAISTDRVLAVIIPLRHRRIMMNYGLKIMLTVVWIVAFAYAAIRHLFPDKTHYLTVVMFACGYSIKSVCYSFILLTLVRVRKRNSHLRAQSSVDINFKIERRIAGTLAIVIIMFSITWFPLIIVFYTTGKPLVKMYGPAFMWIRSLALSNSAMNFVIYNARTREFRDAYIAISRKMFSCRLITRFSSIFVFRSDSGPTHESQL
ncbi:histamine H2 receptor-like [Stylophora pistillata]|uniref:histamine H2 receptor-like n=1 Tax=Stylophora pistillata TaxID=50429 RepID=UPI000C0405AD|nr:histamine H2 receptor-like [Stylophora pistillata]